MNIKSLATIALFATAVACAPSAVPIGPDEVSTGGSVTLDRAAYEKELAAGHLAHQMVWPRGTKVVKRADGLEITLPEGFYAKIIQDQRVYAAQTLGVSCSCTQGSGCNAYEKTFKHGATETGCQISSCAGICNATFTRNGAEWVEAKIHEYVAKGSKTSVEMEIGTVGQFLERQGAKDSDEFFYQSFKPDYPPDEPREGFIDRNVEAAYTFAKITNSPMMDPQDLEDPKVIHEMGIYKKSLLDAMAQRGIPDNGQRVWVPILVKGRLGFWQVPAAFLSFDNNHGFIELPPALEGYSCSGCNGACTFTETISKGGEVTRSCK